MNRALVVALVDRLHLGGPARAAWRMARSSRARLRSLRGAAVRRVDLWHESRQERRWSLLLRREMRVARTPSVTCGTRNDDSLLVVMCLWKRPERLPDILKLIAGQVGTRGIRLVLWNNNPETATENRRIVEDFGVQGALTSVEYIDSPSNLLGMARFVVIRTAAHTGYSLSYAVTLDDDQDVPNDFIATLDAKGGPYRVAGWWACSIHGTYWERVELQEDGAVADYVGTGGAVWPVSMCSEPAFFRDVPLRYRMIEDVWASVWATRHGWPLTKVAANVTFALRERDQVHGIEDRKTEFWALLQN